MRLGEAWVEMLLRDAKYKRDLKSVEKQTNMSVSRMASSFKRLGGAIAGAFSAYTISRFASSAISAASNLEEVSNKFNVVFRGQTSLAEQWAKTLQKGYLMSGREAKQYLSSMQDLLVPMGMAADAASRLSFEITKLAADLGSFNNLPTAQVMADIQSALVGNYETMKKYGVVLNATVVQEKALAMGLASTRRELTAAQRAQAAYDLIVQGSQAAIGDVARSSDSYANTMKKLEAATEDLSASLGDILLPTATEGVSVLANLVRKLDDIVKERRKERVPTPLEVRAASLEMQIARIEEHAKDKDGFLWRWLGQRGLRKLPKLREELAEVRRELAAIEAERKKSSPRIAITVHPGGIAWGNKTFPSNLGMPAEPVLGRTYGLPNVAAMMAGTKLGLQGQMGPLDQLEKSLELVSSQRKASETALIVDTRKTMDAMVALTERTAEAMQQNFSDLFFDAMKGKFKDLGDYATAFLNSFERALADVMGQFMTQKLFGKEMKGGGLVDKAIGTVISFFSPKKQAAGGIIPEPVFGIGASGQTYTFGENGPETVVPGVRGLQPGAGSVVNITINAVDASSFADLAKRNPGAIVAPVMEALNQGNLGLRNSIRRVV